MTQLVWHYTNASGLMGIVQSRCLWATSCFMLNDSSEYIFGLNVLLHCWQQNHKNIISEIRNIFRDSSQHDLSISDAEINSFVTGIFEKLINGDLTTPIFVTCASKSENNLSQWRAYSNGSGFALGFRRDNQYAVRIGKSEPIPWVVKQDNSGITRTVGLRMWREVYYDSSKHEWHANGELRKMVTLLC